jgi:hypothetical protein
MIPTDEIKSFSDVIEIGTTFGKNWFRGHSKEFNNLIPRIFRSEYRTDIHKLLKPEFEFETIENFKRYAPSIIPNLPEAKDYLSWLFIMQHHAFSTRLLDWSENILVALFFSVIDSKDDNGELWSLLPYKLNSCSGFWGIPVIDHPILQYLSSEPFYKSKEELMKKYSLNEQPNKPIAFLPTYFLPRISGQLSAFTIHPEPTENNSINELIQDEQYLVRYIIPRKLKNEFEQKLGYLGISYRTLFPDLEGLAKDFKMQEKYFGWGQPLHPKK